VNPTIGESGDHVGGIVGFLRGLSHLSSRVMPSRTVIVWEAGGSPRRRAIYKDYKHGRRPLKLNRYYGDDIPDTVENRNDQVSSIISILRNLPVDQVYIPDCEADDIIGFLVNNLIKKRCVIASSDRDLYQLLSKNVIQWSPGQKKFITTKDVLEKFNISVINFCTARSFIGDSSDGLSGIPLAGFTSLPKRFPQLSDSKFVSVEDITDSAKKQLEEGSKLKIIKNVVKHEDVAKRNWKLMYLGVGNLSASQIEKINFMFENPHTNCNKLELLKTFSKFGINNFDIDSFYSTVSITRKNN